MRINACCLLGSVALKTQDKKCSKYAIRGLICFCVTHWCPDLRQACIREINNLYCLSKDLDLDIVAGEEGLQEQLLTLLSIETHALSYCAQLALSKSSSRTL